MPVSALELAFVESAMPRKSIDDLFKQDCFPLTDVQTPGKSLEESLERSLGKLYQAVSGGYSRWAITYSGGKDSTLLTVMACEIVRRKLSWGPSAIDVIYSDTLQEIPPMHDIALKFLEHIRQLAQENGLPISVRITRPDWHQTFWFLILGKGYPVPHRRFWWCTERLKIKPVQKVLKDLNAINMAVLTGVRFGESDRRDGKMKQAAACLGEGECGQVLRYQGALAPIAHWKTCQVWDFLAMYAPLWGWPTSEVVYLYGDTPIRFGCWTCTLVDRDRALEVVIKQNGNENLKLLSDFRQRLQEVTSDPASRVLRPNGVPGKLKREIRQKLLDELIGLQQRLGRVLILEEEVQRIHDFWAQDEKGDSY